MMFGIAKVCFFGVLGVLIILLEQELENDGITITITITTITIYYNFITLTK